MGDLSFRDFLEEEENKAAKTSHFDALADEFGIDPEHLKNDPKVASFFSLGGDTYNLGAYEILDYKYGPNGKPTHALVRMTNQNDNRRRYKKDSKYGNVRIPDAEDNKTYLVPIEDLQDLMTQGMGGAAAGGMPPGGAPPMM